LELVVNSHLLRQAYSPLVSHHHHRRTFKDSLRLHQAWAARPLSRSQAWSIVITNPLALEVELEGESLCRARKRVCRWSRGKESIREQDEGLCEEHVQQLRKIDTFGVRCDAMSVRTHNEKISRCL
jgi:hypothetical protein